MSRRTPLATLAGTLDLNAFKPVDESIALQPLLDVQPPVKQANVALARAAQDVTAIDIDTDNVLAVVRDAVTRLQTVAEQTASSLNVMDRAVTLLPAMLGTAPFTGDLELRSTPLIALHETDSLDLSCERRLRPGLAIHCAGANRMVHSA
ncbi:MULTISPECIES: hypothetical protein [unclassified Cryobacterium]|uniref:hypothetical protein n=1 Tax=unclassified Cryobacterium TaxID=2649013 RepID=UPI000CE4185E|nr:MULTISPECIES: hypothetical protein [unclassified Cryobacterium]